MKVYLAVATVLGGLTLFLWGAFAHIVIPWEGIVREFRDPAALAAAIRDHAPSNGIYFAPQGVFVAVSLNPDLVDKSQNMGPSLLRQVLTDMATALVLALALLHTWVRGSARTAGLFVLFALAAGLSNNVPARNWYGFSLPFTLAEMAERMVSWALVGLVIGGFGKKFLPA